MLVGSVERDAEGRLYNMVALLDDGRVVAARRKHELPNYGTFDEKRVFAAGPLPEPVEWSGVRLGLPICADGWYPPVCAHLAAEDRQRVVSGKRGLVGVDRWGRGDLQKKKQEN